MNCSYIKEEKMISDKQRMLLELFEEASKCTLCKSFNPNKPNKSEGKSDGLINCFSRKELFLNIPSIWTDWINRSEAKIMIVGQDWGPYTDMYKYYERYSNMIILGEKEEDAWKSIVDEKESMTKQLLKEFLVRSAEVYDINLGENFLDSFYITNAVLCARKGSNYRGTDNFSAKFCTENCSKMLRRQIDVIKPLIVITLGYWPFYSICKNYNIVIYKTLKENLLHYGRKKENLINISTDSKPILVLPVYHPAAQVSKKEQISLYCIMWEIITEHYSKKKLKDELCTYKFFRKGLSL